jgi:hypothetical protein
MSPDSELFWVHVESPAFQAGLDDGYWGLLQEKDAVQWPIVPIWVKAVAKGNCPDRYVFRFDLAGYPQQAPTACPWDAAQNTPLNPSQWPRGRGQVGDFDRLMIHTFPKASKRAADIWPIDRRCSASGTEPCYPGILGRPRGLWDTRLHAREQVDFRIICGRCGRSQLITARAW